jgi:hypothetical protein
MTQKSPTTAHGLLRQHGLTDEEAWSAAIVSQFAADAPDEYERVVERICGQDGDPVKKMVRYAQKRLQRLNRRAKA